MFIMNNSTRETVLDLTRDPVSCGPEYPDFVVYPRVVPEELRETTAIPAGHIALQGDFDSMPSQSS